MKLNREVICLISDKIGYLVLHVFQEVGKLFPSYSSTSRGTGTFVLPSFPLLLHQLSRRDSLSVAKVALDGVAGLRDTTTTT